MPRNTLISVLAAMLAVLLVTGCDGDGDSTPRSLAGTWELTSITYTGDRVVGGSLTLSATFGLASGTLIFNDDNTWSGNVTALGDTTTYDGTWSASEDQLSLTSLGQSLKWTYVIAGNTLTTTYTDPDEGTVTTRFMAR